MAKISKEEYELLKGLDDKWKWIARTELGSLKSFESKPCKDFDGSWKTKNNKAFGIYSSFANLFQFIQWEDSEPYNIQELIEEYESEETEVKRNLKEAILGIEVTQFDGQKADLEELVNPRQLEEVINDWMSEVLSQEWIDEHAKAVAYDGMPDQTEVVYVDDLQNLLVPKQKEVDRAYKDGHEKGKQHTFYKGYLEGITDKGSEPETVADVVTTFWKSYERLKEVMSMEVEELEE